MITKKDIIAMAKHVVQRSSNVPDRRLFHPMRDWLLGILFFVILTAAGVVYSADRFSRLGTITDTVVREELNIKMLDIKSIDKVLESHSARDSIFNSLIETALVPASIELVEENAQDTLVSPDQEQGSDDELNQEQEVPRSADEVFEVE